MATSIEWTNETWNPVVGCDRISPGCAHCYAKDLHDRRHKAYLAGKMVVEQYSEPFELVQLKPDRLDGPLRWRKPRKVFVNSVSDLFHDDVPFQFIREVYAVMRLTERHTFQVLTKRAQRALEFYRWYDTLPERRVRGAAWPLPNVWLGVSVESQRFADERIPLLLQTPAAIRFISAEPLLGPVDLTSLDPDGTYARMHAHGFSAVWKNNAIGRPWLDWVIVGGESGPGARPFDLAWARSIVQQCKAAGVACFVKQLGARPYHIGSHNMARGQQVYLRLKDKKGGDPSEWPDDLRVREYPEVAP